MATFHIAKPRLLTFGQPGVPYLSFDRFNNIVQVYRDEYLAAQRIEDFLSDMGVTYMMWTASLTNYYRRNLIFDEVNGYISISIEIPNIDKKSTFPFEIKIFDERGVFFIQHQEIAVQTHSGNGLKLTGWRKVPAIRDFVLEEAGVVELDDDFIGQPLVI